MDEVEIIFENQEQASLSNRWLGKEKFFHDLDIYTIDQFRSDYEEWKKANNRKKFDVQGHDNFESHLLLSTGLFLKNREYLGNKDYYEKYFDKLEDMDDDTSYFFINQKDSLVKLPSTVSILTSDLKLYLLTGKTPGSLVKREGSLVTKRFNSLDQKVNLADKVYGFKYRFIINELDNLFYHIYREQTPFSETLLDRAKLLINKDSPKKEHMKNAFRNLEEKIDCFEQTNFDNEIYYFYKEIKNKLNDFEKESNTSVTAKINIGEKIIRNLPQKKMPTGGDMTYWSVYSDQTLLHFLIEFSKAVGSYNNSILSEIFERIVPFNDAQRVNNEEILSKSKNDTEEDTGLDELGSDVTRTDQDNQDNIINILSEIEDQLHNDSLLQGKDFSNDKDTYENIFLKSCLEMNIQGLNSFEAKFLEHMYGELSDHNQINYLFIFDFLKIRSKLLQSIYVGKLKIENLEKKLETSLGKKKMKVCNDYFEDMLLKINESRQENNFKDSNNTLSRESIINYFLYRFVQ